VPANGKRTQCDVHTSTLTHRRPPDLQQ